MLRWGVQRGTAIIPKTSKVERLQENIALYDFNLLSTEMDSINSLNKDKRFADIGTVLEDHMNIFYPIYE